ncbi:MULTISPECIES: ABC transporter permease [unclassified Amycolatopsis]|uniref:ABC transporter permease n=1 Tax=unclassified Amycolatopsis TaxID=2618356 RepID=UPI001FF0E4CC|nr:MULTISPECIES: ABC transporter permease [unclassified Amycolatopsis]UOZ11085.1 ABC transporter permease [Amycolatopsis sp. WQ 127309]WSJ77379.1 ABC transporter permease [Amycolatopsis sp. NBC_01307]WSK79073.1 ABC transporter permease [Amycolatopsis sp. NBC_01286]
MSTPVPDVRMSAAGAVGLVASREIGTRVRSKAYRVTTVVMLLLIVVGIVVIKLISGGGGADATIGYTPATAGFSAPLQATGKAVDQSIDVTQVADEAAGRAKLADGSIDALLTGDGKSVHVQVKKDLDGKLANVLQLLSRQVALDQQITTLGGNPAQFEATVSAAKFVEDPPLEEPYDYNGQQLVLGIVAGILIYLSLMINGQSVAQGVVEEKTSRVVELLLSTIKPWQLMAGKVLGIGVVGLIQMVVIGAGGVIAGLATGVLTVSVSAAVGTVVWLIVWYLLGFFMYSIVFAALGALVSRQEDVGGAVMPALMFVIAGYVVGISVLPSDPGNTFAEVLSVIPVFAPTLMPMRLAMGGVPVWEAVLSVGLVVLMIPVLIWLAARIYRNAVMRSGAKVKLRDALRAA